MKVDFKWQFSDGSAQWLYQEAPKHFLKRNLHQKKVMVAVWWSAASLIHSSFLNPRETIASEKYDQEIDEMHWNCNTCRRHWSKKGPVSFSGQCPTTLHTTNASKVEWIGLGSFASFTISTWPLANWLPLLQGFQQLFAVKTLMQEQDAENAFQEFVLSKSLCFPRVCRIPKHRFLCYRNKHFWPPKMWWL